MPCSACGAGFGLLRWRHVCYDCAGEVCGSCVDTVSEEPGLRNRLELCPSCAEKRREETVYASKGHCIRCMAGGQRGQFPLYPSKVAVLGNRVMYVTACPRHGDTTALYCSNAAFFKRMQRYERQRPSLHDIEDAASLHAARSLHPAPLCVELDASIKGSSFRPYKAYIEEAKGVVRRCGLRQVVLRVNGGPLQTLSQVKILNREMKKLAAYARKAVSVIASILIELPYDRLFDMISLEDSAFCSGNVYPMCSYFLLPQEVGRCVAELGTLCDAMEASFPLMQLNINIHVHNQSFDFTDLYRFMHSRASAIKSLILTRQRPTQLILHQQHENLNLDPMWILDALELASEGKVSHQSFLPFSVLFKLTPLLERLGFGKISIEASPFCAFFCILVNTEHFHAMPLNKVLNLDDMMLKLHSLDRIDSFFAVRSLQKIVDESMLPEYRHLTPDIASLLLSDSRKDEIVTFLRNVQIIAIHNTMDLGCFDVSRRCSCFVVRPSPLSRAPAAACSGCL